MRISGTDRFPQGDQFLINWMISQGVRVRAVACRRVPLGRQALKTLREILLLLGSQRGHDAPPTSSLDNGRPLG